MKRLVVPMLAVLACAAGAAPASAAKLPTAPKHAKFLVSFEGERSVKWDIPRWAPPSDCYHRRYQYGNGDEMWKVKSKQTKLLAVGSSNQALIKLGTWSLTDATPLIGIPASGIRTRNYYVINGSDPGSCGGEQITEKAPDDDCGTKLPKHSVVPGFTGKQAFAEAIDAPDNQAPGFETCKLFKPRKMTESWDRIPAKFASRDLFNKRKKTIAIRASKSWDDAIAIANGGLINTTGSMSWTMTLTRVK